MPGCVYRNPQRPAAGQCGAPIANYQMKMCQRHAVAGRGMHVKGVGGTSRPKYEKFPVPPKS